jgi:methyl-accepting chemotaxis protein
MQSGLLQRLSLFDVRGYIIVSAIVLCFLISLLTTLGVRARYARIAADLAEKSGVVPFETPLLRHIVQEVRDRARSALGGPPNVQAIIEHNLQQQLRGALLGERFVRASTGLVIILGLVGTFYGLSLSISKLVSLLSADSGTVDITQALTVGLTDTLSGMSVAFTSSLAGIAAAILLTLLGVVLNVSSARTALMLQLETYLDRLLATDLALAPAAAPSDGAAATREARALAQLLDSFGQSVAQLDGTMTRFESALQNFSTTTRDFREFNLHLKDNVQRMSLSFADLSEVLKAQATQRGGPRS